MPHKKRGQPKQGVRATVKEVKGATEGVNGEVGKEVEGGGRGGWEVENENRSVKSLGPIVALKRPPYKLSVNGKWSLMTWKGTSKAATIDERGRHHSNVTLPLIA